MDEWWEVMDVTDKLHTLNGTLFWGERTKNGKFSKKFALSVIKTNNYV